MASPAPQASSSSSSSSRQPYQGAGAGAAADLATQAQQQQLFTTDEIQKKLDANQGFIFAILEAYKRGEHGKCVELQKKLYENLVELATIADYQPNVTHASPAAAAYPQQASPAPQ